MPTTPRPDPVTEARDALLAWMPEAEPEVDALIALARAEAGLDALETVARSDPRVGYTDDMARSGIAPTDAVIGAFVRAEAGVSVEALEALVEAIVTTPLVEVEDETTITLCVPLAAIKPAYWAACAAIGHQPTDPGPYCARCGATLTAVVQSAEHHPGDCAAVEEAGSSPARGAALPRDPVRRSGAPSSPLLRIGEGPEEPRVERCFIPECDELPDDHHHPFTPEAR